MGGAQPLAVTMNDGVVICVECDPHRIERRLETPLPRRAAPTRSTTPSSWRSAPATSGGRCRSACSATPPRWCPQLLERGAPIDIVTDQTSAHDPLFYLPVGIRVRGLGAASAPRTRSASPSGPRSRWPRTCGRWSSSRTPGAEVFDYGNSIRDEARKGGYDRAFEFPGFVPAYIRPLFCEGKGPFRWAALSGDPADIAATDRAILELFPDNERLRSGSRWPASGSRSRGCRRGSAGWGTASATWPV